MTTKELIEKLNTLPPETEVTVWDAYHDKPTTEVIAVHWPKDNQVSITNCEFGEAL